MKKQIKKVMACLLSISMCLGFAACGNNQTARHFDGSTDDVVADKLSQEEVTDDKGELLKVDENNNKYIQLDANSSEISNEAVTDLTVENATSEKSPADKNNSTVSFQTTPKGEYNKGVVLIKVKDIW